MAVRIFTGIVKLKNGTQRRKKWEAHNKPPKSFAAFKEYLLRPSGEGAELVELKEKTKTGEVAIDLTQEETPPSPDEQEPGDPAAAAS